MPAEPQNRDINPANQTSGRTLDHAAPVYDLLAPLMTFGLERGYRRRARALLQLQSHEQVLDVGCGTGTLSREIARELDPQRSRVVGVDAATAMIEVARRKGAALPNLQFDAALAEQLPYPDGSFDCAVSTFFFHHIEFALKQRSLAELRRTVKPGGRIVIVDVDVPSNPFGALCAWSGYLLFRQEEIRENIRGRLRQAIQSAGFSSVQLVSRHSGYISIFLLHN
jgi:demethylmenaquinone methyltransferase/2-methoxy-6-polyprenyl-1,4-benzoquinol methylase/phosphoethanolamine N-methyltransferase